jgi:hypothetical protein
MLHGDLLLEEDTIFFASQQGFTPLVYGFYEKFLHAFAVFKQN